MSELPFSSKLLLCFMCRVCFFIEDTNAALAIDPYNSIDMSILQFMSHAGLKAGIIEHHAFQQMVNELRNAPPTYVLPTVTRPNDTVTCNNNRVFARQNNQNSHNSNIMHMSNGSSSSNAQTSNSNPTHVHTGNHIDNTNMNMRNSSQGQHLGSNNIDGGTVSVAVNASGSTISDKIYSTSLPAGAEFDPDEVVHDSDSDGGETDGQS